MWILLLFWIVLLIASVPAWIARSDPSSLSDKGGSTGQSSATGVAPAVFALSYLEIKVWCGYRDRNTHGLTEAQAREIITKLRQGIGPDLDSLVARVGAMRVRSTKILLLENAEPFKLQANQGSNECLH